MLGLSGVVRASENPLKNDCENANTHTCTWWCSLCGVGTFAEAKVLEKIELKLLNELAGLCVISRR